MSTTDPFKHLSLGALEALKLSAEERIKWFKQDRWIEYGTAKLILTRVQELLTHPKILRMPCLLVVGESNNGKSSLLDRIEDQNPPVDTADGLIVPVLNVSAPSGPDELRLYNNMLDKLGIPYNPSDNVKKREPQTLGILGDLKVRLILIDEIHHSLAGPITKQKVFLNAIKLLSSKLQIPIVAAGTREAGRALAVDPQLANRFDPMKLPQWPCNLEWQKLIVSFERLLPLPEPSLLASSTNAQLLYNLTEGWIGELKKLLIVCLTDAIHAGKPRIDAEILKDVAFVPPSKRRAEASKE